MRRTLLSAGLALLAALSIGFGSCRPDTNIEVANLNLLHGFACDPLAPATGDQCRVEERIGLLSDHIVDAGCPDVVTLQENVVNAFVLAGLNQFRGPLDSTVALLEAELPSLAEACGFPYHLIFDPEGVTVLGAPRGIDEEVILSRYPALEAEVRVLYSPFEPFFNRHALHARIDHPLGPVDIYTTHLASGSDQASSLCGTQIIFPLPCPALCDDGVDTARECQAKELAAWVEATHDVQTPAFITGDFNATPDSNEYQVFASRAWIDTHLAVGNGECEPSSGKNCTSGRDAEIGELEDPAFNTDARIDYIFLVPPSAAFECGLVRAEGRFGLPGTGLFASEPNPFAESCGAAHDPICWTSDHTGNQANLRCSRARRRGDD